MDQPDRMASGHDGADFGKAEETSEAREPTEQAASGGADEDEFHDVTAEDGYSTSRVRDAMVYRPDLGSE